MGFSTEPFPKAMLMGSKDIVDLNMVRSMTTQYMFHDFTQNACEGDRLVVIYHPSYTKEKQVLFSTPHVGCHFRKTE